MAEPYCSPTPETKETVLKKKDIIAASLFTGLGGPEYGLSELNWKWGVEANTLIHQHYTENHNGYCYQRKVQDMQYDRLAVYSDWRPHYLHASPVCKHASKANMLHTSGETEEDYTAAMAVCNALQILRPMLFTMENVVQYARFKGYKEILKKLTELGYHYDSVKVNAADYGVPQNRVRMMLVASNQFPVAIAKQKYPKVSWYEAIQDLIPTFKVSDLTDRERELMPKNVEQLPGPLLMDAQNSQPHKGKRIMNVVGMNEPSFCTTASVYKSMPKVLDFENNRIYRLSTRAIARLQTIPDTWQIAKTQQLTATMIGNALPPALARRMFLPYINMITV